MMCIFTPTAPPGGGHFIAASGQNRGGAAYHLPEDPEEWGKQGEGGAEEGGVKPIVDAITLSAGKPSTLGVDASGIVGRFIYLVIVNADNDDPFFYLQIAWMKIWRLLYLHQMMKKATSRSLMMTSSCKPAR